MANKYAVASGLWSATGSWSDTDANVPGAAVPADDDAVFICTGSAIQMDSNLGPDGLNYAGLRAVTIRGATGTPGMLYFKDGTSGYLKVRTTYNIVGTTGTNKGRILANSDGVWRGIKGTVVTGSATNDTLEATSHGLTDATMVSFFPSSSIDILPAPLIVGTNYYVRDKTDNTFKVSSTSGSAAIDLTTNGTGTFGVNTCLAFTNKAVVDLGATSKIDAQYLDVSLNCFNPTTKYLRTYGVRGAPVLGASYAFHPTGDVIKNTAAGNLRAGGAASSLEVVPLSNCGILAPILVCEWTELAVPASSQNKSVYVKGEGWSVWPLAAELYFEAEYISNATTFARTTVASTQVLTDNTTWTQLSVTFAPANAAHVRYRVWLKKFATSCKIYVDNQLVSA